MRQVPSCDGRHPSGWLAVSTCGPSDLVLALFLGPSSSLPRVSSGDGDDASVSIDLYPPGAGPSNYAGLLGRGAPPAAVELAPRGGGRGPARHPGGFVGKVRDRSIAAPRRSLLLGLTVVAVVVPRRLFVVASCWSASWGNRHAGPLVASALVSVSPLLVLPLRVELPLRLAGLRARPEPETGTLPYVVDRGRRSRCGEAPSRSPLRSRSLSAMGEPVRSRCSSSTTSGGSPCLWASSHSRSCHRLTRV